MEDADAVCSRILTVQRRQFSPKPLVGVCAWLHGIACSSRASFWFRPSGRSCAPCGGVRTGHPACDAAALASGRVRSRSRDQVEVVVDEQMVRIFHGTTLVATHARGRTPPAGTRRPWRLTAECRSLTRCRRLVSAARKVLAVNGFSGWEAGIRTPITWSRDPLTASRPLLSVHFHAVFLAITSVCSRPFPSVLVQRVSLCLTARRLRAASLL